MKIPPFLQLNDKVAIIASARKVSRAEMQPAIKLLNKWGLQVVVYNHLFAHENQFAGADNLRAADLQNALDDKDIKAIFMARGGYGTLRIIDHLNFSKFNKKPKWIIGFSDITVLHSHIQTKFKIATLHAAMPITFGKDELSTFSLKESLFGNFNSHSFKTKNSLNRIGIANGKIVGGNLSLLYAMQGSKSDIKTKNKILFIEDLDEQLYHIDRMILSLKRARKLSNLKALIVGSMIDMKDNSIPYGKTAQQIIYDAVKEYDYPVVFDFPAGHDVKNIPLFLGMKATVNITKTNCELRFEI